MKQALLTTIQKAFPGNEIEEINLGEFPKEIDVKFRVSVDVASMIVVKFYIDERLKGFTFSIEKYTIHERTSSVNESFPYRLIIDKMPFNENGEPDWDFIRKVLVNWKSF